MRLDIHFKYVSTKEDLRKTHSKLQPTPLGAVKIRDTDKIYEISMGYMACWEVSGVCGCICYYIV